MQVRHIQVQNFRDQWAGGNTSPGPAEGAWLVVSLVQHDGPGTVEFRSRAEVDVGDDQVKEACFC